MQNESSSQQRQSWLGGLFGGSRRKQKRASVAITHSATKLPSPQIDAYEDPHGASTDNNTVYKPGPSLNRKLAPSPFALKTPGGSSLLKKREKKQKKKTRGTSWPLASKGGSASSTTTATTASPATAAAASARTGSNGSLNSNTSSSSTTTISTIDEEEDRAIMGGGSAPTSPLGSSPGLALASLSLGNPKTSSLHRRRQLRVSQKKMSRFVEQPLGRGGVQERSPGHAQPWSPRTCLHLNATPPDSPVWGFGTTVPSPTTTTTTTTTTSSAAATTSPNAPTATATTTATTTLTTVVASTTSTNCTNTATTECVTSVFDEGSSSTTTPSTQGSGLHHHQAAASSSWQGTMFGFGDVEDYVHMDQWAANHVASPRKLAASFC